MRNWAALLLMGTVGCASCSGGETPPSPDQDVIRDGGIWSPDRGAGIEVLARRRSLPPARVASAAELRPDAGPGPFTDMRVHVDVSGTVGSVPCPVPSGSYCDGFAVLDASGATIAVDSYAYLGPKPAEGSPAPPSDEVRQLVSGWAPGRLVSVHGVVVARWKSSSGAFGFAMQDPDGAPSSGVRLVRSRSSPVPASAPEVGDWIRVTARATRDGEHLLEL